MLVSLGALLRGLIGGATVMYFADPRNGKRRRAQVTDQVHHLIHEVDNLYRKGSRDLANRSQGWQASARSLVSTTPPADDRLVVARVRSKLGHYIEDSSNVQVSCLNGLVTLRGTIRPGEAEQLIPLLEKIPGVRGVESGLSLRGEPIDTPNLRQLTPGNRMLMAAGGSGLILNGLARRGIGPFMLSKLGLFFLVRGLSDRPVGKSGIGRLIGFDLTPQPVHVHKTVRIKAPVEEVFDLVSDVEQFHLFLPVTERSETLGPGRHRWTANTPLGSLTFEEQVVELVPNERLVLQTTPDAPAPYREEVRFRTENEFTILDIDFEYFPPAGPIGHAAASFLGIDPRTQLSDALHRQKTQLEATAPVKKKASAKKKV